MKYRFRNQNNLIQYLIDNKLVKRSYENYKAVKDKIEFNEKTFIITDFLNYLHDLNLIEFTFEYNHYYDYTTGETTQTNTLLYIELNQTNLGLLISNNLVTNDIYQNRLLSIKSVCEILELTRKSVYNLMDSGKLPYHNILSQRKIKHTDLIKYINSNKAK